MDKTKIFIINTKGDIRYTTKEGEEKHTNFVELERLCDAFFPPVGHLERRNGVDDDTKAACCVCLILYEMVECANDVERRIVCFVGSCCAIRVRLEVVGDGMRAFSLEVGYLHLMLWKQL